MLKIDSYSAKGTKLSTVSLPKEFEAKPNLAILAQAIRVYGDRKHPGLAKTKTRSEVNRTKKKFYKQKGTGGARHGARSAHIFVGGGVVHGPRGIKRVITMPTKMRRRALAVSLQLAIKQERVVAFDFSNVKNAKDVQKLLSKKTTFVLSEKNIGVKRFLKNIKDSRVVNFKDLNAHDVFFGGKVIFDTNSFAKEKTVEKGKK